MQIRKPIHPALMMFWFWGSLYVIHFLAPIIQLPAISLRGFMFTLTMLVIFAAAAFAGSLSISAHKRMDAEKFTPAPPTSGLLNVILLIGILGGAASILAKVGALQDLSLEAFSLLRTERAGELIAAEQGSHGLLGALGFLCYPAGFVGILAALLRYEQVTIITRALVAAYIATIFLLSIIFGGRSMIFALILFVALGVYLRRCRGLSMVPRSKVLRGILIGMVLFFAAYSTLIWQIREDLSEMDVAAFFRHAEEVWGVKPTPNLEAFAEAVGQPSLARSVMNTIFYFTQSLSTLEKILSMEDVPVLLGGYHIDLVAAALRTSPESAAFLGQGYAALLDENIYGYFAGAWGGLYIDFGLLGCILGVVLWGALAGRAYRIARTNLQSERVVLYVFWLYSVLISFVSPPFGFSNSAVIFFWFVVYAVFSAHPVCIRVRLAVREA